MPKFTAFAEHVFQHLPRIEQRTTAASYIQGILTTPDKKSINRAADALGLSGAARHALRHFINDNPWPWDDVRQELAR
ncbi:hypothetical protein GCM10022402_27410 [Salinactinospora qingdaonensis]|uniref:Transposase IS701-like DDE domain-containing protein n=1 Tax=Salinactinospora qingdaonensis TaxID=702744 RepID=A0ABP7FUV2_9ACTN